MRSLFNLLILLASTVGAISDDRRQPSDFYLRVQSPQSRLLIRQSQSKGEG